MYSATATMTVPRMFRQSARGPITPRSQPTAELVTKSTTVQARLAAAAATSSRGSDTVVEPAGITICAPHPAAAPPKCPRGGEHA